MSYQDLPSQIVLGGAKQMPGVPPPDEPETGPYIAPVVQRLAQWMRGERDAGILNAIGSMDRAGAAGWDMRALAALAEHVPTLSGAQLARGWDVVVAGLARGAARYHTEDAGLGAALAASSLPVRQVKALLAADAASMRALVPGVFDALARARLPADLADLARLVLWRAHHQGALRNRIALDYGRAGRPGGTTKPRAPAA